MSLPSQAEYVIVGAGIHGLSTAWRLAERLTAAGESVEGRIVIVDKADRIAAGATGIACGVVRNNYFQPAMRKLMAHSVIMQMAICKFLAKKCEKMLSKFMPNRRRLVTKVFSLKVKKSHVNTC